MRHELKTWPKFFVKIMVGTKTCEWRKDDRNFCVGDTLLLREYDNETNIYSGREIEAVVTDVVRQENCKTIPYGFCAMSIKVMSFKETENDH